MPEDQNHCLPKANSIFRQAAIDTSFMQQYGGVSMLPKINHIGVSLLCVVFVALSIVYVSTQPFFETVDVAGWINTKTPNIDVRSQESAGIVKQLFVHNGSEVKAGQTIAILTRAKGEALGEAGIHAQRQLILQEQVNKLAILKQRKEALTLTLTRIELQYQQTGKQLTQIENHQRKHQAQLDIAKQRFESMQALLNKGLIALIQVEQSELQMLSLQQQDFDLFMRSQTIQSSYNELREQRFTNTQQQRQIEHEINLSSIQTQQKLDALRNATQLTVSAPSSGVIDNLQIDVGKDVRFNQVITQIAPINPRYFVQLAIPSHQVAFLQKNQHVQIRVDGFAYQKFGSLYGVITHISDHLIAPQDINARSINASQGLYLVDIDIDYTAPESSFNRISLRSGMAISASVNKQETTILEWLLGPLLDIVRPSFAANEAVI